MSISTLLVSNKSLVSAFQLGLLRKKILNRKSPTIFCCVLNVLRVLIKIRLVHPKEFGTLCLLVWPTLSVTARGACLSVGVDFSPKRLIKYNLQTFYELKPRLTKDL